MGLGGGRQQWKAATSLAVGVAVCILGAIMGTVAQVPAVRELARREKMVWMWDASEVQDIKSKLYESLVPAGIVGTEPGPISSDLAEVISVPRRVRALEAHKEHLSDLQDWTSRPTEPSAEPLTGRKPGENATTEPAVASLDVAAPGPPARTKTSPSSFEGRDRGPAVPAASTASAGASGAAHGTNLTSTPRHDSAAKASTAPSAVGSAMELADPLDKFEVYEVHLSKRGTLVQKSSICRIPSVWRSSTGVFIVPGWLQDYTDILLGCGIDLEKVAFANETDKPAEAEHDLVIPFVMKDDDARFALDLILSMPVFEVVCGAEQNGPAIKYSCFGRNGECTQVHSDSPPVRRFKPLLMLHHNLENAADDAWTKSFVQLFHGDDPAQQPAPGLEYYNRMYSSTVDRVAFRSVFFFNRKIDLSAPFHLEASSLSSLKNIERAPRTECPAQITLLAPANVRGAEGGPHGLKKALDAMLGEKNRTDVVTVIEDVREWPFSRQLQLMRDTDALIAEFSDSLSNLLFLRKRTPVYELSPFLHRSDTFATMARMARVRFKSLSAKPDVVSFERCIMDHSTAGLLGIDEAERIFRDFQSRAHHFDRGLSFGSFTTALRLSPNAAQHARSCVFAQDMNYDMGPLAEAVLKSLPRRCP